MKTIEQIQELEKFIKGKMLWDNSEACFALQDALSIIKQLQEEIKQLKEKQNDK